MTTVHVILPNGETYETANIQAETTSHAHQTTDDHEAVHVDDNQIKIDADTGHVIDITKDLGLFENYIRCRTANNAEVFAVRGSGEVVTTAAVVAHDVDAEMLQSEELFTDRIVVPNVVEVLNDADNIGTADDASRIVMTQPVYIQPKANSNIPPTLNTSGSIAVQGAGKVGFVPTHPNGATIDGAECTLGRSRFIGDFSHDNDGLLLRFRKNGKNHKVLLCAEPGDPNLIVYSHKANPYMEFVNVGPDQEDTEENVVFRVKHTGDIQSTQMDNVLSQLVDLENEVNQLRARLDLLEG